MEGDIQNSRLLLSTTLDSEALSDKVSKKRKRRAVLSCNDCRRRKMKCDRELPCARCVKGGIAASCAYDEEDITQHMQKLEDDHKDSHSLKERRSRDSSLSLQASTNAVGKRRDPGTISFDPYSQLNGRIKYLEQQLKRASQPVGLVPLGKPLVATPFPPPPQQPKFAEREILRGQGYQTQCYGPSCPLSALGHFPELRTFMKEVYPTSSLLQLDGPLKTMEERRNERIPPANDIRAALPDRLTVDHLVHLYFSTFDTVYRLFHRPTFWDSYEAFWKSPLGTNDDFVIILLTMMASVICTSANEPQGYGPNGSTARNKAILWIRTCEAWLERQSNKHRSLAAIQVRMLRLIALSTNCLKTKQYYQEVKAHFAYMTSIGMHRDPSILGSRCKPLEAEMRRRLWTTTMEMELQASVDRGIPSALSSLQYDCTAPRNINDADFATDAQDIPQSQPCTEFTDTSFLHISYQTIPLRVKLCALANAIYLSASFTDTLAYEEEIVEALDDLPHWSDPRALQANTLLDLQLRQFIAILHFLEAQRNPNLSRSRYSKLLCVETSIALIDAHAKLVQSSIYALCVTRSDYFRAGIYICQIAFQSAQNPGDILARATSSIVDSSMQKALLVLEERCMRPGRGFHQYWFISAAYSLLRTVMNPSTAATVKHKAPDKLAKLYYRVLAQQEESSDGRLLDEATDQNATLYHSTGFEQPRLDQSQGFGDFANLDFANFSEWTLDDLWSFNLDSLELPTV